MGISRQTFSRILGRARHTVATCLTQGLALRIDGGKVELSAPEKSAVARKSKPSGRRPAR
jgi:predicted DNA-binding protein (UPF0251 family)